MSEKKSCKAKCNVNDDNRVEKYESEAYNKYNKQQDEMGDRLPSCCIPSL
jgi:hypothetical protein